MSLKFALLALPLVIAPLALAATPAAAQSLSETHELHWAPAGKTTPLVSYRPIKRRCAAAPQHLSGKTPHMTAAPACTTALATAEHGRVIAARD